MKTKVKQNTVTVKVPSAAVTSLVEDKLKGKSLFAEKIETVKVYLNKVKISAI
jgi:hypothetical protein